MTQTLKEYLSVDKKEQKFIDTLQRIKKEINDTTMNEQDTRPLALRILDKKTDIGNIVQEVLKKKRGKIDEETISGNVTGLPTGLYKGNGKRDILRRSKRRKKKKKEEV